MTSATSHTLLMVALEVESRSSEFQSNAILLYNATYFFFFLTQQIFIECQLCVRHCSRYQENNSEQDQ